MIAAWLNVRRAAGHASDAPGRGGIAKSARWRARRRSSLWAPARRTPRQRPREARRVHCNSTQRRAPDSHGPCHPTRDETLRPGTPNKVRKRNPLSRRQGRLQQAAPLVRQPRRQRPTPQSRALCAMCSCTESRAADARLECPTAPRGQSHRIAKVRTTKVNVLVKSKQFFA